jgi:hypothetical protein
MVVEFRASSRFSSMVSIALASSLQDGIGLRTSKYKPIHLSGVLERWIFHQGPDCFTFEDHLGEFLMDVVLDRRYGRRKEARLKDELPGSMESKSKMPQPNLLDDRSRVLGIQPFWSSNFGSVTHIHRLFIIPRSFLFSLSDIEFHYCQFFTTTYDNNDSSLTRKVN